MKFNKRFFAIVLAAIFVLNIIYFVDTRSNNAGHVYADAIKTLNILEVEPGTYYNLSTTTFSNSGYNVNLTQMPMSEFIGRTEQLNGLYDMIYIGSNNSNGVSYTKTGSQPEKAPENVWFPDPSYSWWYPDATHVYDNGAYRSDIEYYSENDITNKRAKDVIDFINSKQLVLFDSNIFTNSSLNGSKLWNNFKTYYDNRSSSSNSNVKFFNSNISVSNIISYYNSCSKMPKLDITASPKDYGGSLSNANSDRNLNYVFSMEGINSNSNTLTAKLYLDFKGNGLYDSQPSNLPILKNKVKGSYSFSYQLPSNFLGLLPWKLEITDDVTGAKCYKTGYTLIKGDSTQTQTVRILQIMPPNSTLNLSTDTNFNNNVRVVQSGYYNLVITSKNYADVVTQLNNASNIYNVFNSNYDMIIVGFADSYGGQDLNSSNLIKALKSYIQTGQSVLFTHDTTSTSIHSSGWGHTLDVTMRDYLGLSRYVDPYNSSQIDLDGTSIPHDSYPYNPYASYSYPTVSYGFTTDALKLANGNYNNSLSYSYTDPNGVYYSLSGVHANFDHDQAYKINDGYLTQFPYVLGQTLNISTTHWQYFQLNLEDPRVVPWFTLYGQLNSKSDPGNQYDPRNYYYAYSKGNITYSGTGHSYPGTSPDEDRLFLNTMVKASTSSNHAPTLTVNNLQNNQNISKNLSNFNFDFTAADIDLSDTAKNALNWKVTINGKQINQSGNIISSVTPMTSGDDIGISISKAQLANLLNGAATNIPISIEVSDPQGAKATQTYTFNYGDAPSLVINSNAGDGYLKGDNAAINLNVTSSDLSNPITFTSDVISGNLTSSPSTWNLSNSSINNSNPSISNNFTFDLANASEGINKISHTFSYSDSKGLKAQQEYDYNINVKSGAIYLKMFNNDCSVNSDGTVNPDGTVLAKPVTVIITAPDGNKFTTTTDNTGNLALLNNPNTGKPLSSGTYTININKVNGYTMLDNATQTVNLSYSNPTQNEIMRFAALTAPTITASVPSTSSTPAWTKTADTKDITTDWTSQDVTLTLTPPSSFISSSQKMQYQVAGGQWKDYDTSNPTNNKVNTEGIQTVVARTVDIYDSTNCSSSSHSVTVQIDKTGPAISVTDTTAYGSSSSGNKYNETNGNVTLHLIVTDTGDGKINNTVTVKKASDPAWCSIITLSGPDANGAYNADFTVSSNDTYTFTATDGLGNVSNTPKAINSIVSLNLSGTPDNLSWNIPGITQSYSYDVYRKNSLEAGYSKITGTSISATSYSDTDYKDVTSPVAPVLTGSNVKLSDKLVDIKFSDSMDIGTAYNYYVEAKGNNDSYVIDSNTVSFNNSSGIKGYYISIDNDQNGNASRAEMFTSPQVTGLDASQYSGDFYVHVAAIDNAGNVSQTNTYHCIPPTAPTISVAGIGQTIINMVNSVVNANGSVNVNIGGSNSGSTPITYSYSLDGSSNWTTGTIVPVDTEGWHTIYAMAMDPLGNYRISSMSFLVDKTGPTEPSITTSISAVNKDSNNVWWTNDKASTFTVDGSKDGTDGSGIMGYQYQMIKSSDSLGDTWYQNNAAPVNNVPFTSAYVPKDTSDSLSEGIYIIYGRAVDNVSNASKASSINIGIDTTPPPQPTINQDYQHIGKVTIDYGTDSLAGISEKLYRILDKDGNVIQDWTAYNASDGVTTAVGNTIQAKSVDYAGNESSLASDKVAYEFKFTGLTYNAWPTKTKITFQIQIILGYDGAGQPIFAPSELNSIASVTGNDLVISDKTSGSITQVHNNDYIEFDTTKAIEGNFTFNLTAPSINATAAPKTYTLKNIIVH